MSNIGKSGIPAFHAGSINPCGKYYFVSEQEGTRKMATMPPSRDPDYRLNVYYCTRCEGFHIGHTQAKVETATASCGGSA